MGKIKEVMGMVEFYNGSTKWGTVDEQLKAHSAIESKLRELLVRNEECSHDSALLGFIQTECLDVRCVEMGEDSCGWEIIQHHMGRTPEVKVGESFREDGLREALEEAVGTITN